MKEIRQLSRFLPVIVFISRSTARHQAAPRKITLAKSLSESSNTTSLLGVFGKVLERFKITSAESMFTFGDVTIRFFGNGSAPQRRARGAYGYGIQDAEILEFRTRTA
jgi:hypothetical protein